MIYSRVRSLDFIFDPRLKWPPISCTWAYPLCILVYGELIKPSLLNQISPTPLNKAPALLGSPSNVFEIDNHPWGRVGGGGGWETMQPECLQGTKRCIRRDLSLNRQIIIFLIEPITGWLLRPIFRLILTGYIYSRYMYDGIEHFYYG